MSESIVKNNNNKLNTDFLQDLTNIIPCMIGETLFERKEYIKVLENKEYHHEFLAENRRVCKTREIPDVYTTADIFLGRDSSDKAIREKFIFPCFTSESELLKRVASIILNTDLDKIYRDYARQRMMEIIILSNVKSSVSYVEFTEKKHEEVNYVNALEFFMQ